MKRRTLAFSSTMTAMLLGIVVSSGAIWSTATAAQHDTVALLPALPRPAVDPHLQLHALLERTIFQVDVLTLELWLGPATARAIEPWRHAAGGRAAADSLARAIADSRDAWAQISFARGVGLDRFLDGILADMRRAQESGLLSADGFQHVADGLPVWLEPLRQQGLEKGDRFLYRVRGDTLRTVVQRRDGAVVIDQTDVGPDHRRALLGSFVAPGASLREGLLADCRQHGPAGQDQVPGSR
jgi:hypothetical protein